MHLRAIAVRYVIICTVLLLTDARIYAQTDVVPPDPTDKLYQQIQDQKDLVAKTEERLAILKNALDIRLISLNNELNEMRQARRESEKQLKELNLRIEDKKRELRQLLIIMLKFLKIEKQSRICSG
ncbi:hypothetical protein CHS0354_035328 [Potamilus streckersoni]|uniref:Uncharacterized protein n=1 Tax=Potamilus streckersoni TaxID=2493646 RepID=A0AAE0S2T4_9BIVA|nr:hypothetical protein CHS0354_035328 [Potamilus streckersoni]